MEIWQERVTPPFHFSRYFKGGQPHTPVVAPDREGRCARGRVKGYSKTGHYKLVKRVLIFMIQKIGHFYFFWPLWSHGFRAGGACRRSHFTYVGTFFHTNTLVRHSYLFACNSYFFGLNIKKIMKRRGSIIQLYAYGEDGAAFTKFPDHARRSRIRTKI